MSQYLPDAKSHIEHFLPVDGRVDGNRCFEPGQWQNDEPLSRFLYRVAVLSVGYVAVDKPMEHLFVPVRLREGKGFGFSFPLTPHLL